MSRTAFIIGGTGQIGIATAAELLNHGWQVTLAHTGKRSPQHIPPGAALAALDRRDTPALADALGTVDLLIDTMAFTSADADQLRGLAGQYGQLSVISSASVYADADGRSLDTAGTLGYPQFDGPVPEHQSTVPPGPESYSTAKVALEQRVLETPARPVTILRPCAIHGINSKHPREWWFVKRMLDGRRSIPLADAGASIFHTTATANLAVLIRIAAEAPATRILNAGDPDAPTVRQIGETLAAHLGWTGSFAYAPAGTPIGQTPWSIPTPFKVSMAAATSLGYRPAGSYAQTTAPYVAWMQSHAADWQAAFPMFQHYPSDPFDYAAEDAALGN